MLHGTQIQSVQKTVNIKETRLGCQTLFPRLIQWNTERAIMIIIKGSANNKRTSECLSCGWERGNIFFMFEKY